MGGEQGIPVPALAPAWGLRWPLLANRGMTLKTARGPSLLGRHPSVCTRSPSPWPLGREHRLGPPWGYTSELKTLLTHHIHDNISSFSYMGSPNHSELGLPGIPFPELQVGKVRPFRWGPAAQVWEVPDGASA